MSAWTARPRDSGGHLVQSAFTTSVFHKHIHRVEKWTNLSHLLTFFSTLGQQKYLAATYSAGFPT